ncbi:hypothetical protein [Burkholderia glumae]|nr:hypothetical protein [Burkholderia glumae]
MNRIVRVDKSNNSEVIESPDIEAKAPIGSRGGGRAGRIGGSW